MSTTHPHAADLLLLQPETREALWKATAAEVERYLTEVDHWPVTPAATAEEIRGYVRQVDFDRPRDPFEVLKFVATGLERYLVHNVHPRHFGLFVPAPSAMGIAADTLVATTNPALGGWHLSPFAVELEQDLVSRVAVKFGYDPAASDGTFTSGGSEATNTAVLSALASIPGYDKRSGIRGLAKPPVLYASIEAHHSIHKAASVCGLGSEAVRPVPVDERLRLNVAALADMVVADRRAGYEPFMVAGSVGTTNAGVIDDLSSLAQLAERQGLWMHVDGAWGGAAVLVPELRPHVAGIERADSITVDPHKWMSVPMAAGLFLTRHRGILERVFAVEGPYMPPRNAGSGDTAGDPYRRSLQWSRRFIGLKLFMTLAATGWQGYEQVLRHQTRIGEYLRAQLQAHGWRILNDTPLPVICFDDARGRRTPADIVAHVLRSGAAWLSVTYLGEERRAAIRACITNFRTEPRDIDLTLQALETARRH